MNIALLTQSCCSYKLTSCDDPDDVIYSQSSLNSRVGKVVTLSSPSDPTCRTVERFCGPLPEGESWTAVTVDEEFEDCEECGPIECECYKLTNCVDPSQVKYTNIDLSAYIGQVVTLVEYPDIGWTVECENDSCGDTETVTIDEAFPDCDNYLDETIETQTSANNECGSCTTNTLPVRFLVKFSGLSGCCSPFANSSIVLTWTGSGCNWDGVFDSNPCGGFLGTRVQLLLAGGEVTVYLHAVFSPVCTLEWDGRFFDVGTGPVPCHIEIQNIECAFDSKIGSCTCESGGTVKVWAI